MRPSFRFNRRAPGGPLLLALVGLATSAQAAEDERRIHNVDQLPQHTYGLEAGVAELIRGGPALAALLEEVARDARHDLEAYTIEDATARKQLHEKLAAVALLEGRHQDAIDTFETMRELEEKPADRWITGMVGTAIARARLAGEDRGAAYAARVREQVRARLDEAPWELVQEVVEAQKGQLELMSEGFLLGIVENQLQPAVDSSERASGQIAAQIVNVALVLDAVLDVREALVAELDAFVAANRIERPDIWPARDVVLDPGDVRATVRVGVWDTGVDVDVFEGRVYVNTAERPDGSDTDGNGFVDDIHGVAYDLHARRTVPILYPLDGDTDRLPAMRARLKGLFDVQASVDSPEATKLREQMATLAPADVPRYFEDVLRFGIYVHGTHVAGIAIAGNPAAEILVARLTAAHTMVPPLPTREDAERTAAMFRDTVAYFVAHGVRVVNMSWVLEYEDVERALEQHGVGDTPEERRRLARELFDIQSTGLEEALRGAPGVLFVGSAGNSNLDVSFSKVVPPAFDLPNYLAVGAVDGSGRSTGFTSFGDAVDVYANGFEVESVIPGGELMRLSGTSMSSPAVVNLAAKLLAIDPSLSPERVIELILAGADLSPEEGLRLVNPRRSVEILRGSAG